MQDIESKWGRTVAERGFTQVPNYLLQLNQFVHEDHQLAPAEMILLLQLVGTWWKKEKFPFPSMRTLATRSGLSERQVQRTVKSLEEKGFVRRVRAKAGVIGVNSYDLTPLTEVLKKVATHYVNEHPRQLGRSDSGSEGEPAQPVPEETSAVPRRTRRAARVSATGAGAVNSDE